MRAAEMKERPDFPLMRQTDIQSFYHMQMPRWLFTDPRFAGMSLDAKVVYTFLLSRFQLSRRNGWTNDQGEVFVIFPRKELAGELRVCEKRVTAAFRTLAGRRLIWEKRCGRGDANQIYLACVQPQEPPEAPLQDRQPGGSKTADSAGPEPPNPRPSYKEKREKEVSDPYVSQPDGRADEEEELQEILDACELEVFEPEVAQVFENAVERLFYSERFRVGGAVLPRKRVRSRLHLLDSVVLQAAEGKLRSNLEREVKNSTAYVMATIFNCISENESDLLVDPYLNSLGPPPGAAPREETGAPNGAPGGQFTAGFFPRRSR